MITPKTTNHGEQTQERGCQQVGPTGGELYTTPKYFENRPAGANNSPENRSIDENSQRTAATTFLHANAKMRWPLSTREDSTAPANSRHKNHHVSAVLGEAVRIDSMHLR